MCQLFGNSVRNIEISVGASGSSFMDKRHSISLYPLERSSDANFLHLVGITIGGGQLLPQHLEFYPKIPVLLWMAGSVTASNFSLPWPCHTVRPRTAYKAPGKQRLWKLWTLKHLKVKMKNERTDSYFNSVNSSRTLVSGWHQLVDLALCYPITRPRIKSSAIVTVTFSWKPDMPRFQSSSARGR